MKFPLAVAFATLIAGSAAVTTVLSQDRPAPTRLGFLDVRKAFDTYRKHKDVIDQLNKKSDDYVAKLKLGAAEIDKQADRLNTMNSGTPEYAQLEEEVTVAKGAIDVQRKFRLRELETERRKKSAAIYKEICDEAQSYGAEKGLAAVLLYVAPDADMEQNFDMFVLTRAVLCRDDQLDVTNEVVSRLNAQLPPPQAAPKTAPPSGDNPPTPTTPDPKTPDPKTPPK